jgi:hypothetical protein
VPIVQRAESACLAIEPSSCVFSHEVSPLLAAKPSREQGSCGRKGFPGLKDEQDREDVIAYLKTLQS